MAHTYRYVVAMKDTSHTSNLKASANQPYHHGNLRLALLNASVDIIRAQGVAALSLRKLADVVGVSRTAPYHHFKDKDALLAAVASQGFEELSQLLSHVVNDDEQTQLQPKLAQAVMGYLHFAIEHPTQYELMFGQALWKDSEQDGFRRTAKDCFRQYVKLFELFSDQGLINNQEPPLRLAQMTWASLHGLARLASDGIFAKQDDIHDIAQTAVRHLELILQSKPA